jgi:hypothetical protein
MPDRDPRLPGDSEDDRGNRERNQRIASIEAEGNNYGTEDDTEADERIYAGMVAVCDESGAVELPPCSGSHPGSDHVATKADQARQSERNQMTWPFGVDEALHGFVGSDAGRHEDRHDDRETCVPFGSIRAQHERDPQRNRRQRITEVVYQVREKGDAAGQDKDQGLDACGKTQDSEGNRYRPQAVARPFDGWVYEAVGMVVDPLGQGDDTLDGRGTASPRRNPRCVTPRQSSFLPPFAPRAPGNSHP